MVTLVTARRTQQPRPHCPPLCFLWKLPRPSAGMLRPSAGMLRPPSIMLQHPPRIASTLEGLGRRSIFPTRRPFLKVSEKFTRPTYRHRPQSGRRRVNSAHPKLSTMPAHLSILPASVPFFKYPAKFPRLFYRGRKNSPSLF